LIEWKEAQITVCWDNQNRFAFSFNKTPSETKGIFDNEEKFHMKQTYCIIKILMFPGFPLEISNGNLFID